MHSSRVTARLRCARLSLRVQCTASRAESAMHAAPPPLPHPPSPNTTARASTPITSALQPRAEPFPRVAPSERRWQACRSPERASRSLFWPPLADGTCGFVPVGEPSLRAATAASLRTPARLQALAGTLARGRPLNPGPPMTAGNLRATRLQPHRFPRDESLGHLRDESMQEGSGLRGSQPAGIGRTCMTSTPSPGKSVK